MAETSKNGIKSTGASGKYRTYTKGDTAPGSPKASSISGGSSKEKIIYPTSGQLKGSTVTVYEGKLSDKQNKGSELLGQLKSSNAKVPNVTFGSASLGFQDKTQEYLYAQRVQTANKSGVGVSDRFGGVKQQQVNASYLKRDPNSISGYSPGLISYSARGQYSVGLRPNPVREEARRFRETELKPNSRVSTGESYFRLFGANVEFAGQKIKEFGGKLPRVSVTDEKRLFIGPAYLSGRTPEAVGAVGFELEKIGSYVRNEPVSAGKEVAITLGTGYGLGKVFAYGGKAAYLAFGSTGYKGISYVGGGALAAYGVKELGETNPGERGRFLATTALGIKPFVSGYKSVIPTTDSVKIVRYYSEKNPAGITVKATRQGEFVTGQNNFFADVRTTTAGFTTTQKVPVSYAISSTKPVGYNSFLVDVNAGAGYAEYRGVKPYVKSSNILKGKNPFVFEKQYRDVQVVEDFTGVLKINPKSSTLVINNRDSSLVFGAESLKRVPNNKITDYEAETVYGRYFIYEKKGDALLATREGNTRTFFLFESTKQYSFTRGFEKDLSYARKNYAERMAKNAKIEPLDKYVGGSYYPYTGKIKINSLYFKNNKGSVFDSVLFHEKGHALDLAYDNKPFSAYEGKANLGKIFVSKEYKQLKILSKENKYGIRSKKEITNYSYGKKNIKEEVIAERFADIYSAYSSFEKKYGTQKASLKFPKISSYIGSVEKYGFNFNVKKQNVFDIKSVSTVSTGSSLGSSDRASGGITRSFSRKSFNLLENYGKTYATYRAPSVRSPRNFDNLRIVGRKGQLLLSQELLPPTVDVRPARQVTRNAFGDRNVRISFEGLDFLGRTKRSNVYGFGTNLGSGVINSFDSNISSNLRNKIDSKRNYDTDTGQGIDIRSMQLFTPERVNSQKSDTTQDYRLDQRSLLDTKIDLIVNNNLINTTRKIPRTPPPPIPFIPQIPKRSTGTMKKGVYTKKKKRRYTVDPLSDALSIFATRSAGKRVITPKGKRYTEEFIKSRKRGIEYFPTTYLRTGAGKRSVKKLGWWQ